MKARIGFFPSGWITRIIPFIGLENQTEETFVFICTIKDTLQVFTLFIANPGSVVSGSGDCNQQRLIAGTHTIFHRVPNVALIVFMQFINDRTMRVLAVLRLGLASHRLEDRSRVGRFDLVLFDVQIQQAGQGHPIHFAIQRHYPCGVEYDARLMGRCRCRINLCTWFIIDRQKVKTDPGQKGRFSILARHFDVGRAEPPQPCFHVPPAADLSDQKRLPSNQFQCLAALCPLALDMGQSLKERAHMFRRFHVEHIRKLFSPSPLQIGPEPFASLSGPLTAGQLIRQNVIDPIQRPQRDWCFDRCVQHESGAALFRHRLERHHLCPATIFRRLIIQEIHEGRLRRHAVLGPRIRCGQKFAFQRQQLVFMKGPALLFPRKVIAGRGLKRFCCDFSRKPIIGRAVCSIANHDAKDRFIQNPITTQNRQQAFAVLALFLFEVIRPSPQKGDQPFHA